MASEEHLKLSHFIKSVHENLRADARILGAEEAWQKHTRDESKLLEYAQAMRKLATKHWESKPSSKIMSRINWVYNVCCEYFNRDDLQKYRLREKTIADKIEINMSITETSFTKPYKLLDVGSCYNPFSIFSEFQTTAIDIAPATASVYKCDFLNIFSSPKENIADAIDQYYFSENYYDIVVFSLVLEYLPTAHQRLLFCENAYKLLKPEGILFIITPDSKHIGANYKIMKTWKYLLAKMGFSRIRYEKLPHIHCMAFRKVLDSRVTKRWTTLHVEHNFYNSFVIPQDFNIIGESKSDNSFNEVSADSQSKTFLTELPFFVS